MIPEIGHFALILVLCIAIVQSIVSLGGAQFGIRSWVAMARPAAHAQFALLAVAFLCLAYGFIINDFSVKYIATQSNSLLPVHFRIAAIWGGHEGSMLLWVLMLSGWTFAVALFSKNLPDDMAARVIGVMGVVMVGFVLFILLTSNPFDRLIPPAVDGRDLNPLLQDIGLIIHPPMLYMGYVGFSVAFAFAIAALLSGRLDSAWARWSRPWTTVAWMFLTLGIALGSWWAYYELGWGGWWFWDPVENASFMPWLMGTALVHSLSVTEKRGSFKNWTVLLAIFAFSLSLLGTFLVRSGVLTSVHSFATDPERGLFILMLLLITIGISLALFAWRAPKVGLGGRFSLVSRESFLLVNNVLFVVACSAVLLGTLYPLIVDALGYGKISVGKPYFDAVFYPLMAPAVFLMAVAPLAKWKDAKIPDMAQQLRWAAGIALVMAIIVPIIMGEWAPIRSIGFALAFWVMASMVGVLNARMKTINYAGNYVQKLFSLPNSFLGMCLAHFGVGIFIVGVTMVSSFEIEKDMRMGVGETVDIGGYTFRFDGVTNVKGPNYNAARGQITVLQDGEVVTTMFPEKRKYLVQTMSMTEAAIDTGLTRDLYVSMGEPIPNSGGAWGIRVYYKPFVDWIWAGAFLMGMGGLLAVTDRRYRLVSRKREEQAEKTSSSEDQAAKPAAGGLATEDA